MKTTQHQLRKLIRETMELDLEIGDVILTGKFKNKRTTVKEMGVDDNGQPTINGRPMLKFRIEKKMPEEKWSSKTKELHAKADLKEANMKITKKQLRKIIKESILLEADDFSTNLKKIRVLLDKDEIEDAAEMYANMNTDASYFGGELEAIRFEYDETRDFFENAPAEVGREFEELAYEYLSDRGQAAISSSSHKKELLAISDSFMTQVTPDEVKHITYQPRIRKGQLANVNMEDNDGLLGNMAAGMTPDEAKKHGTTLDKVMSTLDALGATKRTRRKPIKYTPPLYD